MTPSADPRCPECGEPIGQTATYCMHCSADLTDEREAADSNDDGVWDQVQETAATSADTSTAESERAADDQLLNPDGLLDNSLTVVVGIVGGIVVGLVGTIVLGVVTGSGWSLLFGFVAWLAATAYLVRRRTVQEAVAKSSYAVATVLLLVPVVTLSPVLSIGGIAARGSLLLVLLVVVAIPAGIAVAIGLAASRFVPEESTSG